MIMNRTRNLRYVLFGLLFALVLIAVSIHLYSLLIVLVLCAIILGVIGDVIENKPVERYKKYNVLHAHKVDSSKTDGPKKENV
jgi:hypothetical protein